MKVPSFIGLGVITGFLCLGLSVTYDALFASEHISVQSVYDGIMAQEDSDTMSVEISAMGYVAVTPNEHICPDLTDEHRWAYYDSGEHAGMTEHKVSPKQETGSAGMFHQTTFAGNIPAGFDCTRQSFMITASGLLYQ